MKNSILVLSFILFISCNSYNDNMNALLNKKSELENAIKITDSTNNIYLNKRLNIIQGISDEKEPEINFGDTTITSIGDIEKRYESKEYKMYSDSVKKYKSLLYGYEESLKQVNYSIDSLFKLK